MLFPRFLQYAFIAIVTVAVGFSLYQWNESRASVRRNTGSVMSEGVGNLSAGLAAYWKFDDGSGTTVTDSSINANNATFTGSPTPTWTTGHIGGSADLSGGTGTGYFLVSSSTPSSLDVTNNFSVSMWFKANTTATIQTLFSAGALNNNKGFQIQTSTCSGGGTANICIQRNTVGNNEQIRTTNNSQYTTGSWTHLLITVKDTTVTMYVNGVSQSLTGSFTGNINSYLAADYRIGQRSDGGQTWDGSIDEVRMYNRLLSFDEIQKLYQSTTPTEVDTSLVGYWPFDGNTTTWTSSSAGTTLDLSGRGNTGTFTNMTRATNIKAGKIGQSIYLNSASPPYVQAGLLPDLSAAGSISVWFRGDSFSTSNQMIVSTANWDTNLYGFQLTARSNEGLTWQLGNASTYQNVVPVSGGGLQSGVWYHAVLTWDGASVVTYLNGAKINTTAQTVAPVTNFYALRIGETAAGSSRRYIGNIDDVRIYNRAVSAGEALALYQMGDVSENTSALQSEGVGNLNSGLGAYWKFDGSGASADDSGVNGTYTGTLQGNTSWTTGQINGGLSFDGTGDYVSASPVATALPVTMCAWFKLGTTGTFSIMSLGDNTLANYVDLRVTATRLSTYLKGGGTSTNKDSSTVSSMVGSWHHGCGVYTASTMQIYLDGNANLAPTSHALTPTGIIETKIGRLSGSTAYDFNGQLDEVRIYNRALSADEINKLYQVTAPTGVDTSLKGYWSFDGNATNWTSSTTGTTADLSGAGNTGTLTNMNQSIDSVSGKRGQGLFFNKVAGAKALLGSDKKPIITGDYSIAFWVRLTESFNPANFVSNYNGFGGDYISIKDNSFNLAFSGEPGDNVGPNGTKLSINKWYFITATRDSVTGTMNLYENGVFNATAAGSPGALSYTLNGQWAFGSGCGCTLDEIRIYDRVLSTDEITALYQTGAAKINATQDINKNGLVAHWALDGKDTVWSSSSAGTTLDTSGNGYTGTLTSMNRSTSVASGKFGQALSFDGVLSNVTISSPPATAYTALTVSLWYKPGNASIRNRLFGAGDNTKRAPWLFTQDVGVGDLSKVDFEIGTASSVTDCETMSATGAIVTNQWVHIIGRWDGTTCQIYINGVASGSPDTTVSNTALVGTPWYIGRIPSLSTGESATGIIDEVRFYNRALSTDEITSLYNAGR